MCSVRVVDAASGAPVAGAEVWAFRAADDLALTFEAVTGGDMIAPERSGSRYVTDQDGSLQLPHDELAHAVVARAGKLFGAWHPDFAADLGSADAIVIALEPEEVLSARCTFEDGSPALGAWMGVCVNWPDVEDEFERCMWRARVERPDGTLTIPHVQLWQAFARQGFNVRIRSGAFWQPVDQMIARELPAADQRLLHVVVPPMGSIAIRLRSSDDATHDHSTIVSLAYHAPDVSDDPFIDWPIYSVALRPGGAVQLVPAGLGQSYQLLLGELRAFGEASVKVDGPTRRGQRVEVVIDPAQRAVWSDGRRLEERKSFEESEACATR